MPTKKEKYKKLAAVKKKDVWAEYKAIVNGGIDAVDAVMREAKKRGLPREVIKAIGFALTVAQLERELEIGKTIDIEPGVCQIDRGLGWCDNRCPFNDSEYDGPGGKCLMGDGPNKKDLEKAFEEYKKAYAAMPKKWQTDISLYR